MPDIERSHKRNVWTDLYDQDIERLTDERDERDEARSEVERLREALARIGDYSRCHASYGSGLMNAAWVAEQCEAALNA